MGLIVLAFDFGTKSIGVAVGQSITGTAQSLPALKANQGVPNWQIIEQYIRIWQPNLLVVGLPLNMDGTKQLVTKQAEKFAQRLQEKFNLTVQMQDERLTTTSAKEEIFQRGGYRGLQKNKIDSLSACLILESWFNENPNYVI